MSQDVHLYGYDTASGLWVRCLVNDEGKLIIDPTEIFESPPTQAEAGKAPQSAWAYDHWQSASPHPNLVVDAHVFAARPLAAAWDFDINDLTEDGSFHELDLSSIVPASTLAVLLKVYHKSTASDDLLTFRRKGDSGQYSCVLVYSHDNAVVMDSQIIVPVDVDSCLEYCFSNTNFFICNILIFGWWT